MNERKEEVNNIVIKYRFKPRKYDTNHLVVVFSGFGGAGEFTYDFINAFKGLRANVLWIKDDFFDHCAYYLAHNDNFEIENSVILFIKKKINELGLKKENVTLVGASKGGSAALFYGLKYDFNNIICSVPQLLIGDYIVNNWPHVAIHMLGNNFHKKEEYNSLILDLIEKDNNRGKNIYLLTSKADIQFKDHIEPYLYNLYQYDNFNVFFSESILVREHNQITSHHTDIIIGLISFLSSGVAPNIGGKILLGDSLIKKKENAEKIVYLKEININNNRLFIDGVGIVRGKEAKDWGQINYKLILKSDTQEIVISIAKAHRPHLTKEYYNGNFCIYDKCWFTSHKYEGIDISTLNSGLYQLYLNISFIDLEIRFPLKYIEGSSDSKKYQFKNINSNMCVIVV